MGPNAPARPKARAAAPASAGGAASVQPPEPKDLPKAASPKAQQPKAPASGWQPTLRAADQVVQQAEFSSVHISSSVRSLPKQSRGVVAPKERDTTLVSSEGPGSAPPIVAVPKVPKGKPVVTKPSPPPPKQPQGVAVPKERDATAIASEGSSSAPASVVTPKVPKVTQQSYHQLLDRQKGLLPHPWRSGVKSQVEPQVHLRVRTLPTLPL